MKKCCGTCSCRLYEVEKGVVKKVCCKNPVSPNYMQNVYKNDYCYAHEAIKNKREENNEKSR